MKRVKRPGDEPMVEYDQLREMLRAESEKAGGHANHECSEACDPPHESKLMEFYAGLTKEQRDMVDMLSMLYAESFRLPLRFWRKPPVDVLPTKGTH